MCDFDDCDQRVHEIDGEIAWELCEHCSSLQAEGQLGPIREEPPLEEFLQNWERQRKLGSWPIPRSNRDVATREIEPSQQATPKVTVGVSLRSPEQILRNVDIARDRPTPDLQSLLQDDLDLADQDLHITTTLYDEQRDFQTAPLRVRSTSAQVQRNLYSVEEAGPSRAISEATHQFLILDVGSMESNAALRTQTVDDSSPDSLIESPIPTIQAHWEPVELAKSPPSWLPTDVGVTRIATGQHVPIPWLTDFEEDNSQNVTSDKLMETRYMQSLSLEFNSSLRAPLLFESLGQFVKRQKRYRTQATEIWLKDEYVRWADGADDRWLPTPEKEIREDRFQKRKAIMLGKGPRHGQMATSPQRSLAQRKSSAPIHEGSAKPKSPTRTTYQPVQLLKPRPSWLIRNDPVAQLPSGQHVPIAWLNSVRDTGDRSALQVQVLKGLYLQSLSLEDNASLRRPLLGESMLEYHVRQLEHRPMETERNFDKEYAEWADATEDRWLPPHETGMKKERLLTWSGQIDQGGEWTETRREDGNGSGGKRRSEVSKIAQRPTVQKKTAIEAPAAASATIAGISSLDYLLPGRPFPERPPGKASKTRNPTVPGSSSFQRPLSRSEGQMDAEVQFDILPAYRLMYRPHWVGPETMMTMLHTGQVIPSEWLTPAWLASEANAAIGVHRYDTCLGIENNRLLRYPLVEESQGRYRMRQRDIGRAEHDSVFEAEYNRWADDPRVPDDWLPEFERGARILTMNSLSKPAINQNNAERKRRG